MHRSSHLPNSFCSVRVKRTLNICDQVVVGVVSEEAAAVVRQYFRRVLPDALTAPHRLKLVVVSCGSSPVFLPYRLLEWVKRAHAAGGVPMPQSGIIAASARRLSGDAQGLGERRSLTASRDSHGRDADGGANSLKPFDLVYYSEADNVVFMARPAKVARALVAFLDSGSGARSYIAPQRLEYGRHSSNL